MITALSIIFLIIGLTLWFIFGKDKKVVPVVSFYPPEDLTPFDVNILVNNGGVVTSGPSSMGLYLLQKNYLSLDENYNFVKNEINTDEIEKMSEIEQVYYDSLIPGFEFMFSKPYYVFSKTKNKYYKSNYWVVGFIFFLSLIYSLVSVKAIITIWIINWLFFPIIPSTTKIPLKYRILVFVFLLILYISIGNAIINESSFDFTIWEILISILTMSVLQILLLFMDAKTEIANKYYGELLGFKDFLQKVEVPQLNELMQKDTDYFLKILPYAIELGIIHKDYRKELSQYLNESSEKQADAFVAVRKKTIEKQEK